MQARHPPTKSLATPNIVRPTGRTVYVRNEDGFLNAYTRVQQILRDNNVRKELYRTQRHEKKGVKRRRLESERWRKRFAHEVCSFRLPFRARWLTHRRSGRKCSLSRKSENAGHDRGTFPLSVHVLVPNISCRERTLHVHELSALECICMTPSALTVPGDYFKGRARPASDLTITLHHDASGSPRDKVYRVSSWFVFSTFRLSRHPNYSHQQL